VSEPEVAYAGTSLREVFEILWRAKWPVIICAFVFGVFAAAYALTATKWYRSEMVLSPVDPKSLQGLASQLGGLGSLASLAGINIGGTNTASIEALAVLQSRDFARAFIEQQNIAVPLLDKGEGFFTKMARAGEGPDIRDAIKRFEDDVLNVTQDKKTNLVTVAVDWTDAETAAKWADLLVETLNDTMRERALQEAEANVSYLQKELATTNVATLQQSIGHLLESELQKLMIAKGKKEYAFRIIDRANVPRKRSRPKRTLIVLAAMVIGGGLASIVVLVRKTLWRELPGGAG